MEVYPSVHPLTSIRYKLNALSGQNQAVLEQLGKLSAQRTTFQDSEQSQTGRRVSATEDEVQMAARRVMAESIAEAEEVVDRLTSEYLPDPQSEIQHSQLGCCLLYTSDAADE